MDPALRDKGRRLLAFAIAAALVAIVACDVSIYRFRHWWDQHALSSSIVSSLLVLGVTALIVDEVLARRARRDRATSVAVQAVILDAQAQRTYAAITAACGPDGDKAAAGEEMRSLAGMLLTASPNLFDDPQARVFLENVQRLAGSIYRVAAAAARGPVSTDLQAFLTNAMSAVQTSREPLAARLPLEYRSNVEESA